MPDIICPHCKKVFQVDESGYADLLRQVRSGEFEKELHEQLTTRVKLAKEETKNELREHFVKLQGETAKKDLELAALKSKLENAETVKELAIKNEISKIERERDDLKNKLINVEDKKELEKQNIKETYEEKLKNKVQREKDLEAEIERIKDFRQKQSTKMVGESLEQFCADEFNKIRMTAFPEAYFEKDNDARSGSKGDFIFRDFEDEIEKVSIMFEMKNESETTATKHKNEDFLKELDRDRREKKCEYAILVSLLESDSDLYNQGIVDVSYRYEKMFVIRPQFFIPMITLLKNAGEKSLAVKRELVVMKNQNLDITHFEEDLENWKAGFAKNVAHAASKYKEAIENIDKSIAQLTKTKEALLMSEKHLMTANSKAEDISVKKLTRNNPTMAGRFEEITPATA